MSEHLPEFTRRFFIGGGVALAAELLIGCRDTAGLAEPPPSNLDTVVSPDITPVPTTTEAATITSTTTTTEAPAPTTTTTEAPAPPPSTIAARPQPSQVKLDNYIAYGPADKPNISITIDDMFRPSDTDRLARVLDVADVIGARMTFFPTGGALLDHKKAGVSDIWRRVADKHEIGHHSLTHSTGKINFKNMPEEDIRNELTTTQDILNDILGYEYRMRLMRPPGGIGGQEPTKQHYQERLMNIITSMGLHMAMWTVDANINETETVLQHFTKPGAIRNGSIVLAHFVSFDVPDMVQLLNWVHNKTPYNITTISGLFEA